MSETEKKKNLKITGRPPEIFDIEKSSAHMQCVIDAIREGKTEWAAVRENGKRWVEWTYLLNNSASFAASYEAARDCCYRSWEQDMLDISDDMSRDVLPNGMGGAHGNSAAVQRDRLRCESRKWLMRTQRPKIYGEKLETEVLGKDGSVIIPGISINLAQNK